jgi:uncharacterized protein
MAQAFPNVQSTIDFSLRLFAHLRVNGIRLGTLQTMACIHALAALEVVMHRDLLPIYRVTLINRKEDLAHLARLFALLLEAYLSSTGTAEESGDGQHTSSLTVNLRLPMGEDGEADDEFNPTELAGYSEHEIDHTKDFRLVPKHDVPLIVAELEKVAKKYASIARRKSKRSKHGTRIDLRASIQEMAKFDGDILEWHYKQKVPTHTHLVLVVDVSGSMEIYSTLLLNFLFFLQRNHHLKMDVFVFSTRLQDLTQYFRARNFLAMLDGISRHFSAWSGGTKIGKAIQTLNEEFSTVITAKSAVVIMSDGWDTGEADLLAREMAKLSRRSRAIIWINPLKGDPAYQPLALGMATARPYCDEFISGHNIDSFKTLANLVAR